MMKAFRKCLYDEVVERLDILEGSPPPAARTFREKCIALFFF